MTLSLVSQALHRFFYALARKSHCVRVYLDSCHKSELIICSTLIQIVPAAEPASGCIFRWALDVHFLCLMLPKILKLFALTLNKPTFVSFTGTLTNLLLNCFANGIFYNAVRMVGHLFVYM